MYSKKLEYFQKLYNKKWLISGIVTQKGYGMPIGSPSIGILDSHTPLLKHRNGPKKSNPDILKELLEIIKEGSVAEVNEELRRVVSEFNVLCLFALANERADYQFTVLRPDGFYYNRKLPLIYDVFSTVELKRLGDHIKDVGLLPLQVYNQLKKDRFINYTFRDIARSSSLGIKEDFGAIVKALSKEYPNKTSFFQHTGNGNRALLDLMSVSFYRLDDVIPMFDYKRSEGVSMEVLLTNSELGADDIVKGGRSLIFRFLFTKHRENAFSIDGELVKRQSDTTVKDVAKYICDLLERESPNDEGSKMSGKGRRKKKEVDVCVE